MDLINPPVLKKLYPGACLIAGLDAHPYLWWNITTLLGVVSSRMTMPPCTHHWGHLIAWQGWKWCDSYAIDMCMQYTINLTLLAFCEQQQKRFGPGWSNILVFKLLNYIMTHNQGLEVLISHVMWLGWTLTDCLHPAAPCQEQCLHN